MGASFVPAIDFYPFQVPGAIKFSLRLRLVQSRNPDLLVVVSVLAALLLPVVVLLRPENSLTDSLPSSQAPGYRAATCFHTPTTLCILRLPTYIQCYIMDRNARVWAGYLNRISFSPVCQTESDRGAIVSGFAHLIMCRETWLSFEKLPCFSIIKSP